MSSSTEIHNDNYKSFEIWNKHTISADRKSLSYYPKQDVSWERMNAWLEANHQDINTLRWKWMGFGNVGEEGFQVVALLVPRYEPLEEGDEGYDPEEEEDSDDEDEEDVPSFDDEEGITTPLRDGLRKEDTEGEWWEARKDTWYRV